MKKLVMIAALSLIVVGVFASPARSQTRVRFARGRTSQTISNVILAKASRTFALYAKSGQVLTATVSSPKECVKFSNGSTSISSQTGAGDNFITIDNACRKRSAYTLVVSINY